MDRVNERAATATKYSDRCMGGPCQCAGSPGNDTLVVRHSRLSNAYHPPGMPKAKLRRTIITNCMVSLISLSQVLASVSFEAEKRTASWHGQ